MKKVNKQLFLLFMGGVIFSACNNSGAPATDSAKDSSATSANVQKMDYAYTIDHPDNWEPGSQQNTAIALKALKAWENRNLNESMRYFADSIQVGFNGIDKKVSNDTLRAWITTPPTVTNQSIQMQDWESVISKDKKTEYVTLWYREFTTTAKGMDSVDVINDIKMKDGKIIGLDQFTRKLHL